MLPSIALALSLAAVSVAAPTAGSTTTHIPITRRNSYRKRDNGEADMDRVHAMVDFTRGKYNIGTSGSNSRRGELPKRQNAVALTDVGFDTSYIAAVSVGTPAQSFDVVLDTGSSDFWLATSGCNGCASGTPLFNPSSSSSFKASTTPAQFQYGSGSASGTLGSDTITFGGFTLASQPLSAVTSVSQGIINGPISGILGMGFQALSEFTAMPFWQNLATTGKLPNQEFAFFLARESNAATSNDSETPGGVFTLGGTNSSLFQGSIDYQSFPSGSTPSYWLQTVTEVLLEGKAVSIGSAANNLAAIDTGTTLIGGPTDAVQNFYSQISGSQSIGNGLYAFPCSTKLNVSFSFGGNTWPVASEDLNFGTVPGRTSLCQGAIFDVTQGAQTSSSTPDWIIGDAFLKSVYSVFRSSPPAVGFAQLSDAAGGSVGAPGTSSSGSKTNAAATSRPSTLLAVILGFATTLLLSRAA